MKFTDYKRIIEKIEISDNCREKILSDKSVLRSYTKCKPRKIGLAAVLTFVIAMIGGTGVFAADYFSIFSRLKKLHNKYDYSMHESLINTGNKINISSADNAYILSSDNSFFDGKNVVFTLELKRKDGKPLNVISEDKKTIQPKYICINPQIMINGTDYSKRKSGQAVTSYLFLDYNNGYIGTVSFETDEIAEILSVNCNINLINCYIYNPDWEMHSIKSNLNIEIPIQNNKNLVYNELNLINNEREIKYTESSAAGLKICYKPFQDEVIVIHDENGRKIMRNDLIDSYEENGYIMEYFEHSATDIIYVEFLSKNNSDKKTVFKINLKENKSETEHIK